MKGECWNVLRTAIALLAWVWIMVDHQFLLLVNRAKERAATTMGRVSRYKKVKNSCQNAQFGEWGFGDNGQRVKKRSLTVRKLKMRGKKGKQALEDREVDHFDAPPDAEDEFDIADLNVEKEKPDEGTVDTNLTTAAATSTLSNSHEEHKLLKRFEADLEIKPKEKYVGNRQEGETKTAFRRRTDREVQQIIHDTKKGSKVSKTKRKTKLALKEKKQKKKGRLSSNLKEPLNRQLPVEAALERRAIKTQVKFGEQAERPPIFKQLPRGAAKKPKEPSAALELLRNKAQAQYALLKAKRKEAGEGFHL